MSAMVRQTFGSSQNRLFRRYKNDAKKRLLNFELSFGEFLNLTADACYYCGAEPTMVQKADGNNSDYVYNGIDRLDNDVGYLTENCVSACKICNDAKGELSEAEFSALVEDVYINTIIRNESAVDARSGIFVGRFQPFHKAHEALIRTKLDQGQPCLILVRDTPVNSSNPFTLSETLDMIRAAFKGEPVTVMPIPDIEGIYYGRKVGYKVEEIDMPDNIKRISATDIRQRINKKDDTWMDFVNSHVAQWLKEYHKSKNKGCCVWLTGLSGSGKTTLALRLLEKLKQHNTKTEYLDGDIVRQSLCKDLGFSKEDRDENIKRISFVASYCSHSAVTICAFISPYRKARDNARKLCKDFIEVFVDAPLEVCEDRDVKGLYKKARAGEIKGFTGIDDPYEAPHSPELHLRTDQSTLEECVDEIVKYLKDNNLL